MYYYKQSAETGDYTDGVSRFAVITSEIIICPKGQTPEENGWYSFASLEECLETWGLTYDPPSPLLGYGVANPSTPRQDAETDPQPVPESDEV